MKQNVATDTGTDKETVSDICDDDVQFADSIYEHFDINQKGAMIHYEPNEKYIGMLHSGSKGVEMYISLELSKEVYAKSKDIFVVKGKRMGTDKVIDEQASEVKKRGILDDHKSSNDDQERPKAEIGKALDLEMLKASDEFEYYGMAQASQKI
jgi:hypothetical protein